MSEALLSVLPLLAGMVLGVFFYGGLWLTIRRGLHANNPALWFLFSWLLRSSLTVLGFYAVSGGDWRQLLLCLTGFLMARVLIARFSVEQT